MALYLYLLCCSVIGGYCGWQLYQATVFQRLTGRHLNQVAQRPTITVIIPFRNEVAALPGLVAGLLGQSYDPSKFRLIFVDDFSSDGSGQAIKEVCAAAGAVIWEGADAPPASDNTELPIVQLLQLADAPGAGTAVAHKKLALRYAIEQAPEGLIVTTDADCLVRSEWLKGISEVFSAEVQVVCGLVRISPVRNFCDYFQYLDVAAYQFLTATSIERGAPTLANGAAFAFRKSAFTTVDGYAGVDHLSSGDDVLLLHKFSRHYPGTAFRYLITGPGVATAPVPGWAALWRQRLRWAGKAGNYQSPYLVFAQYLTFFTCLACLLLLPITWHLGSFALLLAPYLAKVVVDYLNLRQLLQQYDDDLSRNHVWYSMTAIIYPLFLVAVGLAAALGLKTTWKGRPA